MIYQKWNLSLNLPIHTFWCKLKRNFCSLTNMHCMKESGMNDYETMNLFGKVRKNYTPFLLNWTPDNLCVLQHQLMFWQMLDLQCVKTKKAQSMSSVPMLKWFAPP